MEKYRKREGESPPRTLDIYIYTAQVFIMIIITIIITIVIKK